MTTNNLLDVVRHYQRSIERHQDNADRLLHCVTKLFHLPIKVEHLQETGIGKTVNSLRKCSGDVGLTAKALVVKWKAMVSAEEEPTTAVIDNDAENNKSKHHHKLNVEDQDENKDSNSSGGESISPDDRSSRKYHRHEKSTKEEKTSQNRHSESSRHAKSTKVHSNDYEHKEHKSRRDKSKRRGDDDSEIKLIKENGKMEDYRRHRNSSISKVEAESSSKRKRDVNTEKDHKSAMDRSEQNVENHKQRKEDHISERAKHHKHRHRDSNSTKKEHLDDNKLHMMSSSSTTSAKLSTNTDSPNNKRQRIGATAADGNDRQSSKSKDSESKIKDRHKTKDNGDEDIDGGVGGFDSSMGTNFADVLGMLNKPTSSSSRKVKKSSTPSSSNKLNGATHFSSPSSMATSSSSSTRSSSSNNLTKEIARSSKMSNPILNSPSVVIKETTKKPDLLSSTAKLEPLDPSILVDLPTTIATNYKPMPLNQTVMDVVFNTNSSSASNNHASTSSSTYKRMFDESEALAQGISSKTMRTKIYSGVRTGQIMQVPSLFDLCIRVLQKNIDGLEYTGGVPFDVLRPVLERATPQQLLTVEDFNPYLMEDTDSLWQLHCNRHYRIQRRQEMETWREMFLRCQEEKDRKLSSLAESIKQQQKIKETPVRKTQLAFVDSMVKPPRGIQRRQEQYGTKGKLTATPAARVAALSSVTPNAAKPGDARLRVIAAARDTAQIAALPSRPKKAPLMAKTLQFMRGRHKR